MFGGFGTNPSTTQATGFGTTSEWLQDFAHQWILISISSGGTFGQNPPNTASVFGAPKPAAGFGTTGTFGTSGFGSTTGTTTTGAFGQPSTTNTTGAFGNTNMFGNKPGFGTSKRVSLGSPSICLDAPLAGQFEGTGNITTGTSNPAYSAFNEKDATNAALTLAYQSITCMPAYRGYSFEVSLIFP